MFNSVNEIEVETKIPLTGAYVDVVQALRTLETQGFFPLRTSGNITLHFNKQGDLIKIVPSLHIDI